MSNIIDFFKENYEDYSNSKKRIARYIIENVNEVSYLKIDELARKVNTDPSTIVRFCKENGLTGYSHLRKKLKQIVMNKLKYSGQFEKAKEFIQLGNDNNIFYNSLINDLKHIDSMINNIEKSKINKFISMITSAKRKYIISSRSSLSLGHFLYFRLKKILPQVYFMTNIDGGMFDDIKDFTPDDLIIAISFPRYSSSTISFVKIAKKNNTKIISITNNQLSPLYSLSNLCLYCPYEGLTFFVSNVPAMALINGLVCALFVTNKASTLNNLKKEEKILLENEIIKKL